MVGGERKREKRMKRKLDVLCSISAPHVECVGDNLSDSLEYRTIAAMLVLFLYTDMYRAGYATFVSL